MKFFICGVIGLFSMCASAAQVCQNVPSQISYSKISNNYDGSVYIQDPKVFVADEYLPIIPHGNNSYNYNSPGEGFCKILKKQFVNVEESQKTYNRTVWINSDSSLGNIYSDQPFTAINWILCK
ncbi:MAG: hypothetical protein H6623_05875 [Bdellovibrionaceae bacterium]|nr:hypothetical protein [Pseudobdellovibrionaceae bacterium]